MESRTAENLLVVVTLPVVTVLLPVVIDPLLVVTVPLIVTVPLAVSVLLPIATAPPLVMTVPPLITMPRLLTIIARTPVNGRRLIAALLHISETHLVPDQLIARILIIVFVTNKGCVAVSEWFHLRRRSP